MLKKFKPVQNNILYDKAIKKTPTSRKYKGFRWAHSQSKFSIILMAS